MGKEEIKRNISIIYFSREMRVLEDEEEVVAGEASEVAEDLEDHSEEGVISAVDSEVSHFCAVWSIFG